jgi:hypothetical protein
MPDYVPHWADGPFTRTASAAITGGQVLVVSGVGTAAPSGGASLAVVGVAAFDAASGDSVTVLPLTRETIHRLTASGTVTAGDQVISAAGGKVAALAAAAGAAASDINAARQVIGVAHTTATDGNLVDVQGR